MSRALADLAKHLVEPDWVTTGWPRIRDTSNNLGWEFDPWQDDLGRLILAKDAEGLYAASICVMSLPRQVGKTYLVGCIAFVVCMAQPGTTVIWTAHRGRTATETFRSMKAKARSPQMAPFIDQRSRGGGIRSSNGEQEIEFLNGSRIMFGAREAGFGVGMADVGMLVVDEIQRAGTKTMDDLLPTTNAAANPIVLCMGTPPRPTDDGEVFTMFRTEALSGESEDVLYCELGASSQFDLADQGAFWEQVRLVNPAFPHRVGEKAILRNKKGLSADSVYREVFGLWDEAKGKTPFPNWSSCVTDVVPADGVAPTALGVDMSHDRVIAVTGCWVDPVNQDDSHLELLSVDVTGDTAAAVEWIVTRAGRRMPVVIDSASPAASMEKALKARRVKVVMTGPADMGKACGGLHDAVRDGHAWHPVATDDNGQKALDDAMAGSARRNIGTAGAWGLDRTDPDQNIAPAVSAVLAHFGGAMTKRKRSKTRGVVLS